HFESSPNTFRGFCPACGTRLYFRSDTWPREIHVHAATMTNPDDYQPDAQVLTRSRMKWLDRLPSIPAHDGFQEKPADRPGT
ncbi:MAG: GFA family protein, partial [Mesorhizobium sp.]